MIEKINFFTNVEYKKDNNLVVEMLKETSQTRYEKIRQSILLLFNINAKTILSFCAPTKHQCPLEGWEVKVGEELEFLMSTNNRILVQRSN